MCCDGLLIVLSFCLSSHLFPESLHGYQLFGALYSTLPPLLCTGFHFLVYSAFFFAG
jgi:hypothetical protein